MNAQWINRGGQKIMKIYISEIIKKLIKPQWTKPQKSEGVKVLLIQHNNGQ